MPIPIPWTDIVRSPLGIANMAFLMTSASSGVPANIEEISGRAPKTTKITIEKTSSQNPIRLNEITVFICLCNVADHQQALASGVLPARGADQQEA